MCESSIEQWDNFKTHLICCCVLLTKTFLILGRIRIRMSSMYSEVHKLPENSRGLESPRLRKLHLSRQECYKYSRQLPIFIELAPSCFWLGIYRLRIWQVLFWLVMAILVYNHCPKAIRINACGPMRHDRNEVLKMNTLLYLNNINDDTKFYEYLRRKLWLSVIFLGMKQRNLQKRHSRTKHKEKHSIQSEFVEWKTWQQERCRCLYRSRLVPFRVDRLPVSWTEILFMTNTYSME
jgi:hypothetical protein